MTSADSCQFNRTS